MTLGLGSVISSILSVAPWIVTASRQKVWMFLASGGLLAVNYWLVVVRPRRCAVGDVCHPDSPTMRFNRRMLWLSIATYAVAFALTFGAPLLVQ